MSNARIDGPGVSGKIEPKWLLDGVMHGTSLIVISDTPPTPKDNAGHTSNSKSERAEGFGVVPPVPSVAHMMSIYNGGDDVYGGASNLYHLGREHGRQELAARLPRVWGKWRQGRWISSEYGPALAWSPNATPITLTDGWEVREFDPRTGGPR